MTKKIAFIGVKGIPANFIGMGGIDQGVEKTSVELVKMGFEVTVFVRNWATPKHIKEYKGIKLIHLPSIRGKNTDTLTHCFLASLYVCFHKFDVVCYRAVGSAFFSFLPKLFGRKIITTIHSPDWDRDKWSWFGKVFLKLCEKIAIWSSDIIIVVSKTLKKRYAKSGKPIYVIPNGISEAQKLKANIITLKHKLTADNYILYMGRFVEEKRLEWLIRAYLKLNTKLKLVLIGDANSSDKYTLMLKKLAKNNKNILFINYVFNEEKEEFLSNCRLFVLPSNLEGCSNVILDIIQHKQSILASDIPENKELINDKYFLFKSASFTDFCDKLKILLQKEKRIYSPQNIKFISWETVAQKYSSLF